MNKSGGPDQSVQFMKRAIELSLANVKSKQGGPFGAVVVKNRKIVGEGTNLVTTTNDPTAHAEVLAIRQACQTLKAFTLVGCEIYTSCEPCPMCLSAIYWARIDRIYYANTRLDAAKIDFDDEFLYQEVSRPLNQRKIPLTQLLNQEALEVFKVWEQTPDKIKY